MATYYSDLVTAGVPAKTGIEKVTQIGKLTIGTALVANDILQMVPVPRGAKITDISIQASGSLGSTLTAEIGDGSLTNRFQSAAAFGQGAAGLNRMTAGSAGTALGYQYTVNDTVDIKIATAAAGTTGQTVTCVVEYIMGDISAF